MSFFEHGQDDLARERSRLEGGFHESEDIAVYTWGEESYDGLGDVLQEEDDLNDETFGQTGHIGGRNSALHAYLRLINFRH
jgi:DNA topoisomerase 2-associated protein PAT1